MTATPEPNAIHLFCPSTLVAQARSQVQRGGGTVFDMDLTGVATPDALVARFIEAFRVPWQIAGMDSIVSVASELYWIPGPRLFLVVVSALPELPDVVTSELVHALVAIIHRMRTAGDSYTVILADCDLSGQILDLLRAENDALAAEPDYPWIQPSERVPIIDHRDDPPLPGCSDREPAAVTPTTTRFISTSTKDPPSCPRQRSHGVLWGLAGSIIRYGPGRCARRQE